MNKINNKIKNVGKMILKLLSIAVILFTNILILGNSSMAADLELTRLYDMGECPSLLTYLGVTVKTTYVEYELNGVRYPAYCLNKNKIGLEEGEYDVWFDAEITDANIWERIRYGYPYKTLEELGVETKEEAFTATKQALYCYMHGNNPNSYEAIGEAGERTLNALKQIVSDAQNSSEVPPSKTITINKDSTWLQDELEPDYMSKTYSLSAEAEITDYTVSININGDYDVGEIKVTDLNNVEKTTFSQNEEFKILVPFKNLQQAQDINISVSTKIRSNSMFYGISPDTTKQNHVLTYDAFSDASGSTTETCPENQSKIVIIKQDSENEERLEGVEFQILNENEEVVYTNLVTNSEGIVEIENINPGKYYIKETKTQEGYTLYSELIEVSIGLNEQTTITINNNKELEENEEDVIVTTQKTVSSIEVTEEKKLPIAGY